MPSSGASREVQGAKEALPAGERGHYGRYGQHGQYAVIWDVDGVLLDSGEQHRLAWAALARDHGFPFSDADFWATFGMRNADIIPQLFGVTNPEHVAALPAPTKISRSRARPEKPTSASRHTAGKPTCRSFRFVRKLTPLSRRKRQGGGAATLGPSDSPPRSAERSSHPQP